MPAVTGSTPTHDPVAARPSKSCAGDKLRAPATDTAAAPGSVAHGAHIAVVEDDEDQAMLLQRWLALDGAQSRWFRSAAQLFAALDSADASSLPVFVLCDWHLGDTNAGAVLEGLRSGGELPCPVVVMSAHTDPARRRAALAAGASAWLSKPVQREALVRLVHQNMSVTRRTALGKDTEL